MGQNSHGELDVMVVPMLLPDMSAQYRRVASHFSFLMKLVSIDMLFASYIARG